MVVNDNPVDCQSHRTDRSIFVATKIQDGGHGIKDISRDGRVFYPPNTSVIANIRRMCGNRLTIALTEIPITPSQILSQIFLEASICSVFAHLGYLPSSATGSGKHPRPGMTIGLALTEIPTGLRPSE